MTDEDRQSSDVGNDRRGHIAEVERWLTVSGAALEMRVARAALNSGASRVESSVPYTDVAESKTRELDVLATYSWRGPQGVHSELEVLLECKQPRAKEATWVLFQEHPGVATLTADNPAEEWVYYRHGPFNESFLHFDRGWARQTPLPLAQVAHRVASVKIAPKDLSGNNDDNSRDGAAWSVRQVLSQAAAMRETYLRNQHIWDIDHRKMVAIMPVVVAPVRLLTVHLERTSEFVIEEVGHGATHGFTQAGERKRVIVCTESALPDLLRKFRDLANHLDMGLM